jgi:hypothetical protein
LILRLNLVVSRSAVDSKIFYQHDRPIAASNCINAQ